MSEKRKAKRIAITALAEVTLPDGRNLSAYVANLSKGGLGLYFKEPLEAGTELSVKLYYRDETGGEKAQELDGEVRWAFNGYYAIGIALDGLEKKENAPLLKYIESVEDRDSDSEEK